MTSMTMLTPAFLANLLRRNSSYEYCSTAQKLHLLQYLLSEQQYESLKGLKLMPLENGSFVRFETVGCVYMCSEKTAKLIPGCEENIVKLHLSEEIEKHLQQIKDNGTFQVKDLDIYGFVTLLQQCMDRNLTDSFQTKVWDTEMSSLPKDWLEKVWSMLAERSLIDFENLHLVPEKNGKYYHLHRLSKLLIVKSNNSYSLPEDLCRSMDRFSVTVLPEKFISLKRNSILMNSARKAGFVPTCWGDLRKPSELYDPTIKHLKELVDDDSMFPAEPFSSPEILVGLRMLGLKTSTPSSDLINSCVIKLDRKVREGQTSVLDQANAVNYFLKQQPNILNGYPLRDKKFLVPMHRPTSSYPTVLPWCPSKHQLCAPEECLLATTQNQRIVGSAIPLISKESYDYLRITFSLDEPDVSDVLKHLLQIKQSYTVRNKPDLLPCINEVYNFLSKQTSTCTRREIREFLSTESLVFTGESFVEVNDVYTTRSQEDIPLEPYMYCLPSEFLCIKDFFEAIGCHGKQTVEVLDIVQKKIKAKHDSQVRGSRNDTEKDLNITVQILTLYKRDPECVAHLDILFPVHTGSDSSLQLMPASECRYSNEEWLKTMAEDDEETIHYVHANIPSHTAQVLGVRSLTEGLLIDTEAIEPCGQHEDLTGRIRGLLDGYTDGLSVPKELIQNADDAAATKVCFLYDERENMDSRTRLIDQNMAGFQGPALWTYNDAQFTKADLRNITKLGGATKQEDDTKVGKFGLGFCSVYNLTDVPSFITGSDIVIFDPHYKYLGSAIKGKEPGIKINLKSMQNQKLVRRMKNQFQPFNGVFGCDMGKDSMVYEGTLFRLPLRTKEQAGKSEIKDTAYSQSDMKELLYMLMENGGNMLLFTQNVTEIEVYHLAANATDPSQKTLIYKATKDMVSSNTRNMQTSDTFNILKEISALYLPVRQNDVDIVSTEKIILTDINIQTEEATMLNMSSKVQDAQTSTRWIISYATGTSKCLDISKQTNGVLPLAGIAVPVQVNEHDVQILSLDKMPFGFYRTGHYFSFLPLPIATELPVHINATFAVAPDRRSIMWGTEDDKIELFKPRWNQALMTDAVPNAYVSLLEKLHNYNGINDEEYMNCWPIYPKSSVELQSMQKAFLIKLVNENPKVFKRHEVWAEFQECKFIYSKLFKSNEDIVFKAAIHFLETNKPDGQKVIRMRQDLNNAFSNAGLESTIQTKICSAEEFFIEVLFPEILSDYWEPRERNMLVMFAVDSISAKTKDLLQNSKCIPIEPTGELKCPQNLVHPDSKLKNLFTTNEGRFVHKDMIEAGIKERKEQLLTVGMIVDRLPNDLIVDRIESIQGLSQDVVGVLWKGPYDSPLIEQLKDLPFLPILKKPKDWTFPWKADCLYMENDLKMIENENFFECNHVTKENVQFAKPKNVYLTSTQHLVGSQEFVMDMSGYTTVDHLGVIGKKYDDIPVKVVCQHLVQLCESKNHIEIPEESKHLLNTICNTVYSFLNERIVNETVSEDESKCIEDLKEHAVFFCHNVFVKPKQTALRITMDCEPHLFGLQNHHLGTRCKSLVRTLGVKDQFTAHDISNVMLEKQDVIGNRQLTEEELELYIKLIKVLVNCMERQKIDYHEVSAHLCIPDINGFLLPTADLCLNDNEKIGTTETMKFVNGKIGPDFARTLGVKAKIKQHFSDNTWTIPFGQKEEITTRIKNILQEYPCDEGIMKELLQNADDAQATELQFIIDSNTYSSEMVFNDKWKPLQGPALLVFNDSTFSSEDIQGIQDLGIGSKGEDPTKTGQYGVGFNAVYHLTDAPSFLTKGPDVKGGETMCVMDPCCQFLSNATEQRPGIQFVNLSEHRKLYPDVFKCYHADKLLSDRGTVFRFPLRLEDKTIHHLAGPMSSEKLEDLFKTFERELLQTLLFVRSVKTISLSDISSGQRKTQYKVQAIISRGDEEKRKAFGNYVRDINSKIRDKKDLSTVQNESVSYNVTVEDSNGVKNTWLIVQQIGFGDGDIPTQVTEACKRGELRLLPIGGVAILLSSHKNYGRCVAKQKHRAFCFLPLPLTTGLPVHVNGHFVLGGDTRSNVWNEERKTFRWDWNKLLLVRVIPIAYLRGMEIVKQMLLTDDREPGLVRKTKQLDDLFPILKDASDENWNLLAKEILNKIYDGRHELFYLNRAHGSSVSEQQPLFVPLQQYEEPFPALFNTLADAKVMHLDNWKKRKQMKQIMQDIGLRLLDSPVKILHSMKDAGVPVSEISPTIILEFLKSFSRTDIEHKCNIVIREDGTDLSDTSLQNVGNVLRLLEYCKRSDEFTSGIIGVPLCLTQDGKLRVFKEDSDIFCSEQFSMLPNSANRFLHHSLVCLLDEDELQGTIFKLFDIHSFAVYLSENLSPEKFRNPGKMVDWYPKNEHIPNSSWICKVWEFLVEQEEKGDLEEALRKLGLPLLDTDILDNSFLSALLPHDKKPAMVLNCLFRHCTETGFQNISNKTADVILEYFVNNIKEVRKLENWIMKLKSLPLHLTIHGEHVSLELESNVLVLPNQIPPDGIKEWGRSSRTLLLKQNLTLQPMYDAFDYTESSVYDVYTSHILANVDCLPRESIHVHLKYIRNILLSTYDGQYGSEQKNLIAALQKSRIFCTKREGLRRASELHSPHVKLFRIMNNDQLRFPMAPYAEPAWRLFMELIGMVTEASTELIIHFARQIETEGRHTITDEVSDKCNNLLECIWRIDKLENMDLLSRIRTIKFIVPSTISRKNQNIYPQFQSGKLMSFEGAVLKRHTYLVWSSCNILPDIADPFIHYGKKNPDAAARQLKVFSEKPPFEKVIQHTQNICDALKEQCEKNHWRKEGIYLESLMCENL
ncbi:LOW QUALITY PROTEIN: sacsin-like [Pecten maximus]|uniref:LOW QUALITY PROTEIN: sacsin-like n=1 Tax=Pecten maximus TaxID=6579 RepID=UPI001457EED1|nr:LOW QUALITY PROTEIN: sacsin-like [Pecten maximus]